MIKDMIRDISAPSERAFQEGKTMRTIPIAPLCILIVFVVIGAMPGCQNDKAATIIDPAENIEQTEPEKQDEQGEKEMEIQLLTVEEFIKCIEENQHLEAVDITVDDLEGIDIEGFIEYGHFTKDSFGRRYLRNALESYLVHVEDEKLLEYLAHELVSVDSTDEEYEKFKQKFIPAIDGKIISSGKYKDLIDWYRVIFKDSDGKERTEYMWIGQTKYLDKFVTSRSESSGVYYIQIPMDSSGFGYEGSFHYNKNKKFFYTGGKFEWGIMFFEME